VANCIGELDGLGGGEKGKRKKTAGAWALNGRGVASRVR
jgi:hypothetical protein